MDSTVPPQPGSPPKTGLVRPRLIRVLDSMAVSRLGTVIAPPGTGKTTLLRQWSAASSLDVLWCRTQPAGSGSGTLLDRIGVAVSSVLRTNPPGSLDELDALTERLEFPVVVVLDGLDSCYRETACEEIERILLATSSNLRLLIGGQSRMALNLARCELAASVSLGAEDLRFRPDEVERLFRAVYRQPLGPEGASNLARRTDGWAAALHLFQRSHGGRSTAELRRAAESLGVRLPFVADYIAEYVLPKLSRENDEFLRSTCVFEVLTSSLCSAVTDGRTGRTRLLELERLALARSADGGLTYRVAPGLRQQLIVDLGDSRRGGTNSRRAADIAEAEGRLSEAFRIRAECGDWTAIVESLHSTKLRGIVAGGCAWTALLPAEVSDADPWCMLAIAQRYLDDGALLAAYRAANVAATLTADVECAGAARRIQATASAWAGAENDLPHRCFARLCSATRQHPMHRWVPTPYDSSAESLLTAGMCNLLAGDQRAAIPILRRCAERLDDSPFAALAARLACVVSGPEVSTDQPREAAAAQLEAIWREADQRGLSWLARLATGIGFAMSSTTSSRQAAVRTMESCERRGDFWGAALISAAAEITAFRASTPDPAGLESLAARFRALGAGVLEAWSWAGHALACATVDLPESIDLADSAAAFARIAQVPGALAMAYAASALQRPADQAELMRLATDTARQSGLVCRPWTWLVPQSASLLRPPQRDDAQELEPASPVEVLEPTLTVRCFGGFSLRIGSRDVDLTRVRPQARTVLRILALHQGQPVHRGVLADAIWGGLDTRAALHALHVSVSSLRRLMEPGSPYGVTQLVLRQGEAYSLALNDEANVDLAEFEEALRVAAVSRSSGDVEQSRRSLRRAVDLYVGDVLPEDGAAEWAVELRDRYRVRAGKAASSLAELELTLGDFLAAKAAASRSVEIYPWEDESWRTLVGIHRRSNDYVAAERAIRRYRQLMSELGIPSETDLMAKARAVRRS